MNELIETIFPAASAAGTAASSSAPSAPGFQGWIAQQFANFSPLSAVAVILSALVVGLLIAFVYRKTYRGVLYSPNFSMTLILLCIVTAPVVMAIGSNVALSMGMVGALSIVRFRTAVKDPLDTVYMFWSITMGILLGAEYYLIALIVVLCMCAVVVGLHYVKFSNGSSYLLVLHYDEVAEPAIESQLNSIAPRHRMRSQTMTRNGVEMTVEVRLAQHTTLVARMLEIPGVHDATLVACQTEQGA